MGIEEYPEIILGVYYGKVRDDGIIQNQEVLVVIGINQEGQHQVIGWGPLRKLMDRTNEKIRSRSNINYFEATFFGEATGPDNIIVAVQDDRRRRGNGISQPYLIPKGRLPN